MYEPVHQPPVSRRRFVRRLALHLGMTCGIVVGSLAFGMFGYEHYERLSWRDAFFNSPMLLGGTGPVQAPQTFRRKLVAGLFAVCAGLILIVGRAVFCMATF